MDETTDLTVTREIADGARVDPGARVGPFCAIGPEATIGPGTVLEAHVTVTGHTTIGSDNLISHGCVIGTAPQDLKYSGQPTYLVIGDRNRFGPNVTVHVGTEAGGYLTYIGNHNDIGCGAHVAHDCYLDDHTQLGPRVMLAGHIRVEDGAVIEEMVGVHHFTTIGRFSRVGARTPVRRDVPPFIFFTSTGYYASPAIIKGVHETGLEAGGLSEQEKVQVRQAVSYLFEDEQALAVKVDQMLTRGDLSGPVQELCRFCRKSLQGHFGRFRETFRGKMPPEARPRLPAEALAEMPPEEGEGLG